MSNKMRDLCGVVMAMFLFAILVSCACPSGGTKEIPQEVQEVLGNKWLAYVLTRADEIIFEAEAIKTADGEKVGYALVEGCLKCEDVIIYNYCYRTIYVQVGYSATMTAIILVHEAAHHDVSRADICDNMSEEYATSIEFKFQEERRKNL